MENVLYRAVLISAAKSEDGDTPDVLHLCEEKNAYILWRTNFGLTLGDAESIQGNWPLYARDKAIEETIGLVHHLREELSASQKEPA